MFSGRKIFVLVVFALTLHIATYLLNISRLNKETMYHNSFLMHSNQQNEITLKASEKNECTKSIHKGYSSRNYKGNWTIVIEFNNGAFELFRNWYSYFSKLSIGVMVIAIADDDIVFKKLQSNSYPLISVQKSDYINIPNASTYNTPLFRQLMSVRATHLLKYLPYTQYLLFSDVDTVWLQNPIPYFKGEFHLWMPIDRKLYCAGFFAIVSCRETIDLIRKWEKSLQERISVNQIVFNNLIQTSKNIKVYTLNQSLFPSGDMYFELLGEKDRAKAVIVHNNFIKGIDNKIDRFKKYNLWNI